MIIDIHAHVYAFPKRLGRLGTTFMSMEQQIAAMDARGIDKAVILPLNNPETPTEMQSWGEVLYICERYPGRFIPFCNIDPRLPKRSDLITVDDFLEILNQCKSLGFKGLGELTARIPWDDPSLDKLLAACEQVGFSVTFHTITADVNSYGVVDDIGLSGLECALQRYPRLQFLGHSPGFWSEISGNPSLEDKNGYSHDPILPGGRLHALLRRYPNLNGDLSAGSGFNALNRDLTHAFGFIEEFQDRLFFGLDICSVKNNMRHVEWLKEHRDAGRITPAAYAKIMWQNADRLLGLKLAE